jgi:sec-independent protein translocase protein TatA
MNTTFGLFNLGGGEIVLILALVLILFGAKKLPELAKGLGQGIKEFKKASREVTDEIQRAADDSSYAAPPPRRLEPAPETKIPEAPSVPDKAAAVSHSPENQA